MGHALEPDGLWAPSLPGSDVLRLARRLLKCAGDREAGLEARLP